MSTQQRVNRPCPPWCELLPDHPWDDELGHELVRTHTQGFGEVAGASVELALIERTTNDNTAPVEFVGGSLIWLDLDHHFDGMSAAQSRQVAAALLNAADALDGAAAEAQS